MPHSVPTNSPTSIAAIDAPDPKAGGACHTYGIQYGGPKDVVRIQFQHGPRGVDGSTPGVFDDDLLAIIQDRMEHFQRGPFACVENDACLKAILEARAALGGRVAVRIGKGILGVNERH